MASKPSTRYVRPLVKPRSVTTAKPETEKANLSCSICLEQYKDPKLLPCGHTFCLLCLEKIIKQSHDGPQLGLSLNRLVRCPDCRSEHCLPTNGASGFVTDYTVVQDIETHAWRVKMRQKTLVCGVCETSGKTDSFCSECDSFLCAFCSAAHKRMKSFSGHQVTQTTMNSDIKTHRPKAKPVLCQQHYTTPVSMYCATCQQLLCTECITKPVAPFNVLGESGPTSNYHSSHIFHSLTASTLVSFEQKLTEIVERTKEAVLKMENELQEANTREKTLKEHPEQLRKAVNEMIDTCIDTLECMREETLCELDTKLQVILEKSRNDKKTISAKLNTLKSQIRFAEKAFECNERSRRTVMLGHASSSLDKCHLQNTPVSPNVIPLLVVQDVNSKLKELSLVVDFNARLLTTSKPMNPPSLKKESLIDVKIEAEPLSTPEFRITYGRGNKCLPVSASQKDKYTWQLTFTPCYVGSHKIEVNVLGKWYSPSYWGYSSFSVDGALKKGDIVRYIPESEYCLSKSAKKPQVERTGKIKEVSFSRCGKGNTIYYDIVIIWEYDSKNPKEEKLNISRLRAGGSLPFEFIF